MANEQSRMEIILEEIKGSVKAIADGHIQLGQQMERGFKEIREELGAKIDDISKTVKSHSEILNSHSKSIDSHSNQLNRIEESVEEIKQDLKYHIQQAVPPAHIAV